MTFEELKNITKEQFEELFAKAKSGNSEAQNDLARCFYYGYGVEQDYEKSVYWYTKAAEQDNADAQYNLGICYYSGQGVTQDYKKAVYWWEKAAEQGLADAQLFLSFCYENSQGVEQDYEKAIYWYTQAAIHGHVAAQNNLAVRYKNGYGVEQDPEKAIYWFKKAAKQGVAAAQNNLGACYYSGECVEQDYKKAVYWFKQAAEQGYAFAQCNLGFCYLKGEGVEQDYEKAVYWYTKAAEQSVVDAQYSLGYCYYNGKGVEQDYKKAVYWYTQAAEQGNADAQYSLGYFYYNGQHVEQDYKKAVYWWKKAVERGVADAQCNLGFCYLKGEGVEQDYKKAVYWFKQAAKQGVADAQCNLGVCYYVGKGVEQDYKKAVYWWKKAAKQDLVKIKNQLGVCYRNGQGVVQDYKKAVYWFKQAAEQGHTSAQFYLGNCYCYGEGVEQDYEKAVYWYTKAAEQGDADAQNALKELRKELKTDEAIKEGVVNADKRHDVFISWNHKDKAYKDALVYNLEHFNYDSLTQSSKVFTQYRAWESDRDATGELEKTIDNAIESSKFFIVILSENSLKSNWVRHEVECALKMVESGVLEKESILPIYLKRQDESISSLINALPEGDVFKKLLPYCANFESYVESDFNGDGVTNISVICEKIKSGFEVYAINNYKNKQCGAEKFKFALNSQTDTYGDALGMMSSISLDGTKSKTVTSSFLNALLSFENGYIPRDLVGKDNVIYEDVNVIESQKSFFLMGGGGSGKSLFVSEILRRYFNGDNYFVRINVGAYADLIADENIALSKIINTELNSYLTDSTEYRCEKPLGILRTKKLNLTLIFDGLDEIDYSAQKMLADKIEKYLRLQENKNDRFIFTSRTNYTYEGLKLIFSNSIGKDLDFYRLCEFDNEQIIKLFDNIADENERFIGEDYTRLKNSFIINWEKLSEDIKKNPMLISNLIFIFLKNRGRDFPTHKIEIVSKSAIIILKDLESERMVLSRFKFHRFLENGGLTGMLEYIAFNKAGGAGYAIDSLICDYIKNKQQDMLEKYNSSADVPVTAEEIAADIFKYLCRRSIITQNKITHEIFNTYFACCYIYNSIYEKRRVSPRPEGVVFRSGDANNLPGEEALIYYCDGNMACDGDFGGMFTKNGGAFPEIASDFIMKLDTEINCCANNQTMNKFNPSYNAFDKTLITTLKEKGFSEDALSTIKALCERNGFYFTDFIKQYIE